MEKNYLYSKKPNSMSIRFASFIDNIDKVVLDVKEFLKNEKNVNKQNVFIIHLLLLEGLSNAVKHGNGYNSAKFVEFSLAVTNKKIKFVNKCHAIGYTISFHFFSIYYEFDCYFIFHTYCSKQRTEWCNIVRAL